MNSSPAQIVRLNLILLLAAGLCLMSPPAEAARAYVTDYFEITFRSGPSIENKVISVIPTGQPVEILETHEGWSYVRLVGSKEDKQMGWVLSRFLVDRPPWKTRFQSVSEENEQLREKASSCAKKLREALRREEDSTARLDAMQKNVSSLADENQRLKSSQQHKWFVIGALVLLCGLLIGLMIGRKQRSRRFY